MVKTGVTIFFAFALAVNGQTTKFIRTARPIAGQYIVILDRNINAASVPSLAYALAEKYGGHVRRVMTSAANGFSVDMTESNAIALSNLPEVLVVEQNGYGEIASATTHWHLDRIDQPTLPLNGQYNACQTGLGTVVYVLDTGVNKAHSEFSVPGGGSKVLNGVEFADDRDWFGNPIGYPYPGESQDVGTYPCGGFTDDETDIARTYNAGHGTAVASLIAGNTVGVAPDARIVPIKVASCPPASHQTNNLNDDEIAFTTEAMCWGLDWIRSASNDQLYNGRQLRDWRPALVNISLYKRVAYEYPPDLITHSSTW